MQCENFFTREKRTALFHAYKAARKLLYEQNTPPGQIHRLAVRMAVNTPQKRFWITPYRVYRVLLNVVNKKRDIKTYGTRQGLYRQIIQTYYRLCEKRMFKGRPLIYVAQFVAYEPSQGFYMSESRAGRLIAKAFREHRNRR